MPLVEDFVSQASSYHCYLTRNHTYASVKGTVCIFKSKVSVVFQTWVCHRCIVDASFFTLFTARASVEIQGRCVRSWVNLWHISRRPHVLPYFRTLSGRYIYVHHCGDRSYLNVCINYWKNPKTRNSIKLQSDQIGHLSLINLSTWSRVLSAICCYYNEINVFRYISFIVKSTNSIFGRPYILFDTCAIDHIRSLI